MTRLLKTLATKQAENTRLRLEAFDHPGPELYRLTRLNLDETGHPHQVRSIILDREDVDWLLKELNTIRDSETERG